MAMLRKIITDIEEHRQSRRPASPRSDWYVGIASDPQKRLFDDHAVSEKNGRWIYIEADSISEARDAESMFLELGYDGARGGGNDDTLFVYAYLKTRDTIERPTADRPASGVQANVF